MTSFDRRVKIFDGHNDALLAVWRGGEKAEKTFLNGSQNHLDLPKAVAGGFSGGLFAIFVPRESGPDPEEPRAIKSLPPALAFGRSAEIAGQQMEGLYRLADHSEGRFRVCRSVPEIERAWDSDAVAAVAHLEGAEPISPDLSNLNDWCDRGLRSIGLVWSRPNAFGQGVPLRFPSSPDTGVGLSYAGKELVRECRRQGILVDVSHLNEAGFWDVAKIGEGPMVATHSNVHAICPAARNLTAEQLACIADTDGLVGANFNTADIAPDGDGDSTRPLDSLLDHIDALLESLGDLRVAIGSDFDGCTIPDAIGNAAGLPNLIDGMRARGHSELTITRIAHENWMRILRDVWKS